MALILALLAGFALGWRRAAARGGTLADKAQYGAAHGIAAVLIVAVGAVVLGFAGLSPF